MSTHQRTKPWCKRDSESSKAYAAFCAYMDLPAHQRSRSQLLKAGWIRTSIDHWHNRHDWDDRVAARDSENLDKAIAKRDEHLQEYRIQIMAHARRAIEVLQEVMDDPDATAATRLSAAAQILDRTGVVVPKRVELTGADGEELFRRASRAMDALSDEQLAALSAVFVDTDNGNPSRS